MAECHPVGFQWVMEAKERGATIIHVDPRFTRTSAVSDEHVPIRVGTDIAFLGGIINHVLQGGHEFREYVQAYTNASMLVRDDFQDVDELAGVFSGFDEESHSYDVSTWAYSDPDGPSEAESRTHSEDAGEGANRSTQQTHTGEASHGAHSSEVNGREPATDPTLEDERCVFQVLKRHFSRYTPEMVEAITGIPQDQFLRVAQAMVENSGRTKTTALVYSVGWTHHTTGAQYIRAASILQLLLGNIGRPGGGILALRGHASIQGSTDIPTLFNILPGYLPMPHAHPGQSLDEYCEDNTPEKGFWGHTRAYMVSLLKAYWGDAATPKNDFNFHRLPKLTGDHSIYPAVMDMKDGKIDGFFVMGQNPAVGSANSKLHREGMAALKWLVVRDLQMIESASFWQDGPEIETGEMSPETTPVEVFFMPAATHTEKEGSFTNTHRLLQWHNKAVEPPDDARSELHFMFHLIRKIREKLADSTLDRDRGILDLAWDYPTEGPSEEPSAEAVLHEISGYRTGDGAPVNGYTELAEDGSTACGCWIYSGVRADGVNQANRRKPGSEQDHVALDWGWAWPMNRRTLYNRASADPEGNPWSEEKKYVWWDAEAKRWTGIDIPDFKADMAPDYRPEPGAKAEMALRGDQPFVMQGDGLGWLYAPSGLKDGPLPEHYEPHESAVRNPLHPQRRASPTREILERPDNRSNPSGTAPGTEIYPFSFMTYRIAEHHTAGAMSRTLPHMAELAPDPYAEISPELAAERGLVHGEWVTLISARTAIEARAMVTERMRPQVIDGKEVHTIGLPYHWGNKGIAVGDSANDLLPIVMDSNTHISEFKVATCDVRPGRRPRGPALLELVEQYRRRAGIGDQAAPDDRTPR